MAFVKDRPNVWISAFEFEQFGRLCWRTEISRARKRFDAAGDGTIEHRERRVVLNNSKPGALFNNVARISEYRYVPAGKGEPSTSVPHDTNSWNLR